MYKKLQLKNNEERRLKAGHLWIYSNEIDTKVTPLKNFVPGELVQFVAAFGNPLGIGYINPKTLLAGRLLTRDSNSKIDRDFFVARFKEALARRMLCFTDNYYRLVFAESDLLPGLIIDRFGDVLVGQINTAGMENLKPLLAEVLQDLFAPKALIWRCDTSVRELEGLPFYSEIAFGKETFNDSANPLVPIVENGAQFLVPVLTGQKTGWFFDQRQNRARVASYVKDKRVLDLFSYLGGFGITAVLNGASEVICIDSSPKALDLLQKNAEINEAVSKIKTVADDAFSILKKLIDAKELFDVIVLDPPAFVKVAKDLPQAKEAYQKLNTLAILLLKPSGILATFSCSLHLDRDTLLDLLRRAALHVKRNLVVIEQLHQAVDQPVHPAISETNYLKGFLATF